MSIYSWRVLYDHEATTVDNVTCTTPLYDQNWHAMLLKTDRVMTQAELEATPEWSNVLAEAEAHTIYVQQIYGVENMAITAVTPELVALIKSILGTVGIDVKSLKEADALLQQKQGDLSLLSTTEKSNLVAAINELKGVSDTLADNQSSFTEIDDSVTDTDSTWSSSKISTQIQAGIDGLIDGAPGTLDTLKELATALQNSPDSIADINTILAKAVRVDIVQNFTVAEKAQGRGNIDAASTGEVQAVADDVTQLASNVGDILSLTVADYTNARDGVSA